MLRAVDDVRSGDIATRLTALLKDRPDRARLHGVKGIHDGARQAQEYFQAEFVATGDQRRGAGEDLLSLLSRGAWGDEPTRALGTGEKFSPELSAATTFTRRAAGAALSTPGLRSDRTIDASLMPSRSEDIVELEVSEDGAIRIMMGRLSDALPRDGFEPTQVLFDGAAVIYTRRMLGLVLEVAEQTGYFGGWALAIGATRLRGLSAFDPHGWISQLFASQSFEDDTYERATLASYADLVAQPGSLADRLLGRFLRKLGTYARYTQQLSNPPAPKETDA